MKIIKIAERIKQLFGLRDKPKLPKKKTKQKAVILIDGDNLSNLRRDVGIWQINFWGLERLIEETIRESFGIEDLDTEKKYYVLKEKLSWTKKFWEYLKRLNYQIIEKSPMSIYHDIIRYGYDVVNFRADILVLVSGHSELAKAIRHLKSRRGKEIKIITINSKEKLTKELKEVSDACVYLDDDDVKDKIKRVVPKIEKEAAGIP